MADGKVRHVVADAGAFLRNAPLQSIGEKIYTLAEVVNEIKDKATLQRLQVLPYEIIFKQPSSESLKFVTDFAKKTGDYRSLSAVDLKVMALTYQLEKEIVGVDHIKSVPDKKIEWNSTTRHLEKPTDIAGFYVGSKKSGSRTTSGCVSEETEGITARGDESHDTQELMTSETNIDVEDKQQTRTDCQTSKNELHDRTDDTVVTETEQCLQTTENMDSEVQNKFEHLGEGETLSNEVLEEESEEEENNNDDEDDDDDGWITPSNIKAVKEKMGDMDTENEEVPVGCLTMDFAIQNVLIQMGLNVISVDGLRIKRAKSFVLRCYACLKITTDVLRHFCPHCGNSTLEKVSMTVEDDGKIRYFLSRRKPNTTRGKKFSLPTPKGGKHSCNPVLAEDTPLPQQRPSKKSLKKMDVFDPDYIAGNSPFSINDITSRASQLGIHGHNRRNPNQSRKKRGSRK